MTTFITLAIIFLYIVIGSIIALILYKWDADEFFVGLGGIFWPLTLIIMIIVIIIKLTWKLLNNSKFIDKIIDFLNNL